MDAARPAVTPDGAGDGPATQEALLARVGQMTRSLHDSLRGLDFDKLAARAAHDIPDARDRLDYVARMTEQAAQKVLNATEAASPLQERIGGGSRALAQQWRDALEGRSEAMALAAPTLAFLEQAAGDSDQTRQHLMNIMMAQDFQDLTGQVIKRVVDLAHLLETQLLQVLLEAAPPQVRSEHHSGLLNGPVINPEGRTDVLSNQAQVDDLLESLGF